MNGALVRRLAAMPTAVDPTDRLLPMRGARNFRDMGGYATTTGRQTRWRTLFRADGLHRLEATDLDLLKTIGLRTVIDLRTDAELALRGRFPVDQHAVDFHHVSVLDATWDRDAARAWKGSAAEYYHRAYGTMLHEGADHFIRGVKVLAKADALPAVFHCAAGKDRTGLLAALVLGALQVDRQTILDDYELTQAQVAGVLQNAIAESPELAERVRTSPKVFYVVEPAGLALTLADLDHRHGSIAGYLRHHGVTEAEILRLQTSLLTG
jgi:protein-tyrosine phosphatase